MSAELGQYALVLALVVAAVQALAPQIGAARRQPALMAVAGPAASVQFLLTAFAAACLVAAFVQSDFSVRTVFANSSLQQPLLYRITGSWGNHEGSLLLWVLILSLFSAAVGWWGGGLPAGLKARVLSIQGLIGFGFLAFILFTSNPFARLSPAPFDGQGLNPVLQDPALALHPPLLYLGYVGLSVAFSFAVAALIEGRVDPAWARWVRPWTLAAWMFLTIGIALGSYWAYYELGWGGWWFWDPVENASLMPWLAATALLHSSAVVERRAALKSWTVLMAILAFSLSLLGTFIVRSGVLNSVHAFASDPTRGVFILIFLSLVIGGSLTLYALRAPGLKGGGPFRPISREGGVLLNNLLLTAACMTVLLGTLYPLFLDALTGEKVSVGPPYFNRTFLPLMAPLTAALAIGPMLAWKRGDLAAALGRLKHVALVSAAAALLAAFLTDGPALGAALGLGLAVWLGLSVVLDWTRRAQPFRGGVADVWRRLARAPRSAHGMSLAHLGVALLVLGATASESWRTERELVMTPGQSVSIGGFEVGFLGARQIQGPNYTALAGEFALRRNGASAGSLISEIRSFERPVMQTTEAAIRSGLGGDLYLVLGEAAGTDGEAGGSVGAHAVRLHYKPLVNFIWIGPLCMALGGLLSLSDRRRRMVAPTRKPAPPHGAVAAGGDD